MYSETICAAREVVTHAHILAAHAHAGGVVVSICFPSRSPLVRCLVRLSRGSVTADNIITSITYVGILHNTNVLHINLMELPYLAGYFVYICVA